MKICLLTQCLYTLGGVQKSVTEIINSVISENVEITVLMPQTDRKERCFFIDEKVKVVNIDNIFSTRFGSLYKLLNIINRRTAILNNPIGTTYSENHYVNRKELDKLATWVNNEKFDVVIGVADKYSLVVSMIADRITAKTVGWMHSTFCGYYETRCQNLYGLKALNSKYLRKLDKVCVLTHRDKERFEEEMGAKCTVLHNPVKCEGKRVKDEKKYDFIFVGRMNRIVKGLDYLIEIMHKVVQKRYDCRLVIVGNGRDEAFMRENVRRLRLENNVEFVGFQHNVDKFYRQAKVLISTSRWEGFGMSITEAMAQGLPCVAFENDGPCEIIADGINGYIIPQFDTSKFAKTLIECIENKENYERLSCAAYERAQDFKLSSIVSQFIKVLEDN